MLKQKPPQNEQPQGLVEPEQPGIYDQNNVVVTLPAASEDNPGPPSSPNRAIGSIGVRHIFGSVLTPTQARDLGRQLREAPVQHR